MVIDSYSLLNLWYPGSFPAEERFKTDKPEFLDGLWSADQHRGSWFYALFSPLPRSSARGVNVFEPCIAHQLLASVFRWVLCDLDMNNERNYEYRYRCIVSETGSEAR